MHQSLTVLFLQTPVDPLFEYTRLSLGAPMRPLYDLDRVTPIPTLWPA
jgi:hypothetical protein